MLFIVVLACFVTLSISTACNLEKTCPDQGQFDNGTRLVCINGECSALSCTDFSRNLSCIVPITPRSDPCLIPQCSSNKCELVPCINYRFACNSVLGCSLCQVHSDCPKSTKPCTDSICYQQKQCVEKYRCQDPDQPDCSPSGQCYKASPNDEPLDDVVVGAPRPDGEEAESSQIDVPTLVISFIAVAIVLVIVLIVCCVGFWQRKNR